jgi:hypothetical protein
VAGVAYERITVSGPNKFEFEQIDTVLCEWRQGDATLDDGVFLVHLADKRFPLTAVTRESAADVPDEHNIFEVLSPVHGLVVVTQTCDVVRKCEDREYLEVSPLVEIEHDKIQEIQKRRLPRYAYLPGLADRNLVVDLDRTMTVEKAVVASWTRIQGCTTDAERVAFAEALARKRSRFAFPNGLNTGLQKFRERIKSKEGKATSEGQLIAALDTIRVQPIPNWDAAKVTLLFWFLLEAGHTIDFDASRKVIENWISLTKFTSPFELANDTPFHLVEPQDMTVQDYLNSYPLDYDDISP